MLRLVLSPRWMAWHLLTLGAMVVCGLLAWWQWSKAGSAMGSALNVGYGLQWPLFAVFFGVMWFRMLRLELRGMRARAGVPQRDDTAAVQSEQGQPAATTAGPSPFVRRRPAEPAEVDPALAEYNRMLAQLAARERDE